VRQRRGFTLLELLVVLALVALVTGLVAPGAMRSLAAAEARGAADDARALLEGLPVEAFRDGHAKLLDSTALTARARSLESWPRGWSLKAEPALQYGPTGVASGGTVQVRDAERVAAMWAVEPVTGRVRRIDADARLVP